MALKDIETIVIVMLENRSFDHMMGYLSLPSANPPLPVDGLRNDPGWIAAHANKYKNKSYESYELKKTIQTIEDPPHDSVAIRRQIDNTIAAPPSVTPELEEMRGFVASYATARPSPKDLSLVMGYYSASAVPTFDLFAREFVVCDKWFSALPTGTQPNRLMAMAGESDIVDNVTLPKFPAQYLVYDWLNDLQKKNKRSQPYWCSYQWRGHPFFYLMSKWRGIMDRSLNDPNSEAGPFRQYANFGKHWRAGAWDVIPPIIFIEPEYSDDFLPKDPNDDHPPTGIAKGQLFLNDIYKTLTSNKALWAKTMLIVTYDEHGGFYDHVSPLHIPAVAGGYPFSRTGPRVPAFVVSPQVPRGRPFSGYLDHTSILQLIADRFTDDGKYSDAVSARQKHLSRLSSILVDKPIEIRMPQISASSLGALKGVAISHSGRRTFITNAARKISTVGGSLRDVQMLAGHTNLRTTQRYIDANPEAQARIVELV